VEVLTVVAVGDVISDPHLRVCAGGGFAMSIFGWLKPSMECGPEAEMLMDSFRNDAASWKWQEHDYNPWLVNNSRGISLSFHDDWCHIVGDGKIQGYDFRMVFEMAKIHFGNPPKKPDDPLCVVLARKIYATP
jgi:hypothetical protein